MATPSGAIRQWQSLPFPVRLAGMFLAVMAVIWLTRWLGGISVLVALLLWCAVGIGLVHASGRLAWVDRYPWAARVLEGFAPRVAIRTGDRRVGDRICPGTPVAWRSPRAAAAPCAAGCCGPVAFRRSRWRFRRH